MQGSISRSALPTLIRKLGASPAVALLGPRQCGKTTLARQVIGRDPAALYLDLERPSDRRKLDDPELFFEIETARRPESLICLDEIQRAPEIFSVLRGVLDRGERNGQLLLLGSASRTLLRQTSESLAGRLAFLELGPFLLSEVGAETWLRLWVRGGFPRSYLAANDGESFEWREDFVRTFLERDIPQLGFDIPAAILHRLWRMLAHHHGQLLNLSRLGGALGVSHTTVRNYLDLLTQTFMVRLLEPLDANVGKRLVKSPKVYLRDSGILHALLGVADEGDLLGHPSRGESFEGLVIENAIAARPGWQPTFYRTGAGAEIDLVLCRGRRRIAVECKVSVAPVPSRGFWNALDDLSPDEAWVIAPVAEPYPIRGGVRVAPLATFIAESTPGGAS